jgi:hypothetical protein
MLTSAGAASSPVAAAASSVEASPPAAAVLAPFFLDCWMGWPEASQGQLSFAAGSSTVSAASAEVLEPFLEVP